MVKLDQFKEFVKKNPKLLKYVKNGESSWQKFYEIYDIYGEDNEVWKEYLTEAAVATASTASISDLLGWFKNINMDSVQSGVSNLQKVLGVVQGLSSKDETPAKEAEYKPRPLYKHFDD